MWHQASGLTFVRRSPGDTVDIEIRFENYYHGDEDAFDGPGGNTMTQNENTSAIDDQDKWLMPSSPSTAETFTLITRSSGQ